MDEKEHTIILVAACIGIAFFVMLLYVITTIYKNRNLKIENKLRLLEKEKQIELLTAISKAEENQKIEIAGQLHDEIIPIIALATSNLNTRITEFEKQGLDLQSMRSETKSFSILQESIRGIIHKIVPMLFTSFGLLKAVELSVKQMNDNADNPGVAEFHNNTIFSGELPFSTNDQLTIFKICREVLNNLAKHSEYAYLKVSLEEVKENFILLFLHDGKGVTDEEIKLFEESSTGMGLKLLKSRLILLNADLIYSKDNDVSSVRLVVPINK
ncbi:MAG: hypothetical protein Q8L81_16620 [Bacteroidota bacterium]|nr:hypothetical protein [Bacteroidota bacterium]